MNNIKFVKNKLSKGLISLLMVFAVATLSTACFGGGGKKGDSEKVTEQHVSDITTDADYVHGLSDDEREAIKSAGDLKAQKAKAQEIADKKDDEFADSVDLTNPTIAQFIKDKGIETTNAAFKEAFKGSSKEDKKKLVDAAKKSEEIVVEEDKNAVYTECQTLVGDITKLDGGPKALQDEIDNEESSIGQMLSDSQGTVKSSAADLGIDELKTIKSELEAIKNKLTTPPVVTQGGDTDVTSIKTKIDELVKDMSNETNQDEFNKFVTSDVLDKLMTGAVGADVDAKSSFVNVVKMATNILATNSDSTVIDIIKTFRNGLTDSSKRAQMKSIYTDANYKALYKKILRDNYDKAKNESNLPKEIKEGDKGQLNVYLEQVDKNIKFIDSNPDKVRIKKRKKTKIKTQNGQYDELLNKESEVLKEPLEKMLFGEKKVGNEGLIRRNKTETVSKGIFKKSNKLVALKDQEPGLFYLVLRLLDINPKETAEGLEESGDAHKGITEITDVTKKEDKDASIQYKAFIGMANEVNDMAQQSIDLYDSLVSKKGFTFKRQLKKYFDKNTYKNLDAQSKKDKKTLSALVEELRKDMERLQSSGLLTDGKSYKLNLEENEKVDVVVSEFTDRLTAFKTQSKLEKKTFGKSTKFDIAASVKSLLNVNKYAEAIQIASQDFIDIRDYSTTAGAAPAKAEEEEEEEVAE